MLVQLITSTTHHTRARACTRPHKHTTHTLVHVQKRSYTRHVLEHAHKLTHKTHLAEKFELGKKIVDETAAGFDFKVCVRMCVCICEGEFCVRSGLKKVATTTSVSRFVDESRKTDFLTCGPGSGMPIVTLRVLEWAAGRWRHAAEKLLGCRSLWAA